MIQQSVIVVSACMCYGVHRVSVILFLHHETSSCHTQARVRHSLSSYYIASHRTATRRGAMLRQGKLQGWLSLPPEAFNPWAQLNGVKFHDVKPGRIAGRGSALLASKAITNSSEGAECLLTVPRDLILGQEQISEQAKVDRDFQELLESVGDFGRVGVQFFFLISIISHCPLTNPCGRR